jgi:hypothetical protein
MGILMNDLMYLNISDVISTKEPTYSKIYQEVADLLSYKIMNGQIDVTKEQDFILSTKFGAVTVNLIPKTMNN